MRCTRANAEATTQIYQYIYFILSRKAFVLVISVLSCSLHVVSSTQIAFKRNVDRQMHPSLKSESDTPTSLQN